MTTYTVTVTNVQPSTCLDAEGAVDANVTITIGDAKFAGTVSLAPNKGRPTVRRRYPLDAAGTPLEVWASDDIISGIAAVETQVDEDGEPLERADLIAEIWHEVDDCARKAGF